MDLNERKSTEKNINLDSLINKGSNSQNNSDKIYSSLKSIVSDVFNSDGKYSHKEFLSMEFSINRYSKNEISQLIKDLQEIITTDDENLRYFSIFLLHTDKDIRNSALNALKTMTKRGINFSETIFEMILSSLLVDVKQETTEHFAIFLAKNENTRLIEYLVENLYYEIYLKNEYLRKEKNQVKLLMIDDKDEYLNEWETMARFQLMSGEKITNLVASADCGEYQDALLEGKGLISFPTCIKALSEYGNNLYLPSLSGLISNAKNNHHKNWLKFLAIVQGNEQFIPDLIHEIEKNPDSPYARYALESLKNKSIEFNKLFENYVN